MLKCGFFFLLREKCLQEALMALKKLSPPLFGNDDVVDVACNIAMLRAMSFSVCLWCASNQRANKVQMTGISLRSLSMMCIHSKSLLAMQPGNVTINTVYYTSLHDYDTVFDVGTSWTPSLYACVSCPHVRRDSRIVHTQRQVNVLSKL